MEKLTPIEAMEVERQEMLRAKERYRVQRKQRLKRLSYLPTIFSYGSLFIILALFACLCLWTGFILGQNELPKKDIYCMKVKVQNQGVVHCTLPKTGVSELEASSH